MNNIITRHLWHEGSEGGVRHPGAHAQDAGQEDQGGGGAQAEGEETQGEGDETQQAVDDIRYFQEPCIIIITYKTSLL